MYTHCKFLFVFVTDCPLCAPGVYASAVAAQQCMTNGNGPVAGSPLNAGRTTGSPTDGPPSMQTVGAGGGQQGAQNQQNGPNNPMAALISVADNLPPGSPQSARGSPPGTTGPNVQVPGGPRSASRGSQHSPNSTGTYSSDTNPSGAAITTITALTYETGGGVTPNCTHGPKRKPLSPNSRTCFSYLRRYYRYLPCRAQFEPLDANTRHTLMSCFCSYITACFFSFFFYVDVCYYFLVVKPCIFIYYKLYCADRNKKLSGLKGALGSDKTCVFISPLCALRYYASLISRSVHVTVS